MSHSEPKKFERYIIYPNESIDKLTVNRPFQRIYEDIEDIANNSELRLVEATEKVYGKAKFTKSTEFYFDEEKVPESERDDYENAMTTVGVLSKYINTLSDSEHNTTYTAPLCSSETNGDKLTVATNKYWIKNDYCNIDFSYMPNGVTGITGTFDIGFNNIPATFGSNEPLSSNILSPVIVSGCDYYINITEEDIMNLTDYVNYNTDELTDVDDVFNLTKLDGMKIKLPFCEDYNVTLKHNICNWTTYSSFKKSYVELHYSSTLDVNSLYDMYGRYGRDKFSIISRDGDEDAKDIYTADLKHEQVVFKQKPMVMMQIGFYNNSSLIKPIFGFDNTQSNESDDEKKSVFQDSDTLSQQMLTENESDSMMSPINGYVMVKKIENEYDDDGVVINNRIYFDIVMKFMVGSAADPKMIHGLTTINSKAKVQFAIIGV